MLALPRASSELGIHQPLTLSCACRTVPGGGGAVNRTAVRICIPLFAPAPDGSRQPCAALRGDFRARSRRHHVPVGARRVALDARTEINFHRRACAISHTKACCRLRAATCGERSGRGSRSALIPPEPSPPPRRAPPPRPLWPPATPRALTRRMPAGEPAWSCRRRSSAPSSAGPRRPSTSSSAITASSFPTPLDEEHADARERRRPTRAPRVLGAWHPRARRTAAFASGSSPQSAARRVGDARADPFRGCGAR